MILAVTIALVPAALLSQEAAKPQADEKAVMRMAAEIQRAILTLPNYGLFDSISFSFSGYNVVLKGFASRPTLKDSAEQVTRKVEGVAAVDNRIEVLPFLPNDDRIRAAVYVRIYGHPVLLRYNPNRGTPIFLSPARIAAGITQDPPIGFHPIHIIVKNGNVTLEGVVDAIADKTIAGLQASNTPGTFAVENNLLVTNEHQKSEMKRKK
jgi:osmotically-inducible protein OsmY